MAGGLAPRTALAEAADPAADSRDASASEMI